MTADCSQDVSLKSLATLFASASRASVLRFFMLDPTRAYYQRQIEAATGLAIRSVQRELERLSSVGLLYRRNEGNRTYYQVDTQYMLFPELQQLVLKTAPPIDRLRGQVAMDEAVRLAFLSNLEERVLLVTSGQRRPVLAVPGELAIELMTNGEFLEALARRSPELEPYLVDGYDLLGRREDMVWRRIEAAGYSVKKREGVA